MILLKSPLLQAELNVIVDLITGISNTENSRFTQFPSARFSFNVTWKFTPLFEFMG
jgi:hypothetical protein